LSRKKINNSEKKLFVEVEVAVWRKIWQDSIKVGKETLLKNDQKGKLFDKLKQTYPDDAMVIFEEAIAFDCMKIYPKAIQLYQDACDNLPVEHWKNNAKFLLKRAEIKNTKQIIPKATLEEIHNISEEEIINYKLPAYFYLHSYYHLPHNIRYLAISSMSRIDTESAMAIAIFRTCLEVSLKMIFEDEYHFDREDKLSYIIKRLSDDNKIDDMKKLFLKINDKGNDAIHDAREFTTDEIAKVIIRFDLAMEYLDKKFKESKKAE
jgi:hypothetical protein